MTASDKWPDPTNPARRFPRPTSRRQRGAFLLWTPAEVGKAPYCGASALPPLFTQSGTTSASQRRRWWRPWELGGGGFGLDGSVTIYFPPILVVVRRLSSPFSCNRPRDRLGAGDHGCDGGSSSQGSGVRRRGRLVAGADDPARVTQPRRAGKRAGGWVALGRHRFRSRVATYGTVVARARLNFTPPAGSPLAPLLGFRRPVEHADTGTEVLIRRQRHKS